MQNHTGKTVTTTWVRGTSRSAESAYFASVPATEFPVEDCNRQPLADMRVPLCAHHIAQFLEDYEEYRATSVERAIAFGAPRTPSASQWANPITLPSRRSLHAGVSVVYYIKFAEHIKIGTTTNLLDRIRTFCVHERAVLATEPGDFQVESQRHAMFAAEREGRSELFKLSDRLCEHVDHVRATFGDPFTLG